MPVGPSRVVAVVGDLIFRSRIRQTAEALGVPLTVAADEAALRKALDGDPVGLVVVDLAVGSIDPAAAIALARAHGAERTIAFVSHVDEESKRRAAEAGCEEILPRSAFTRDLPRILRGGG